MSLTSGTIEFLLKAELTGMGIEEVRSIRSKEKMPHDVDMITSYSALRYKCKMNNKNR